tara:strand:- start:2988 stop:3632 length:645 start_codon:yes stop_codon:yes gene_type:complete
MINEIPIQELILNILFSGTSGFLIIFSHSYFSYKWFRNNLNSHVGIVLPILGCVIVTVIGSNIALSLGMIGALSIVRFRTPVRSAYELVIYFSLLTVGISYSVDILIGLILSILLIFLPIIISFFIKFYNSSKYFDNKKNYSNKITLDLETQIENDDIMILNENKNIKYYSIIKSENNKMTAKVSAEFENIEDKSNFLNNWSSKVIQFNVSKDT